MSAKTYEFCQATMDDVDLITHWQAQPHVRRWWDASAPYTQDDMSDPRVSRWIVSFEARPFAFMQDYTVHGWGAHHFANLATGARGIDQFIGDPDMIGIGHGSGFIAERMRDLFDAGAPMIATDPHPDNARAIAVYAKLGFQPLGPPQDTRWGLILPMVAKP